MNGKDVDTCDSLIQAWVGVKNNGMELVIESAKKEYTSKQDRTNRNAPRGRLHDSWSI